MTPPPDFKGILAPRILKRLDELGGKTINQLADEYGLARTTLYDLMQGRTLSDGTLVKPTIDTLVKLAHMLDVPTHVLLYELVPDAPGAPGPAEQ